MGAAEFPKNDFASLLGRFSMRNVLNLFSQLLCLLAFCLLAKQLTAYLKVLTSVGYSMYNSPAGVLNVCYIPYHTHQCVRHNITSDQHPED